MSMEIRLPKLGVSMVEATLLAWEVPDGSTIQEGQIIYSIETDKVEMEIEAPATGTLTIRAAEGSVYQVGDLLAEIV